MSDTPAQPQNERKIVSPDLRPGTKLRYRGGRTVVTLDRRKSPNDVHRGLPYHHGWWLCDGAGGLADFVIEASDGGWTVLKYGPPEDEK